jgi:hypothetical protein
MTTYDFAWLWREFESTGRVYLNEAGDETPKSVSFGLTIEK